MGFMDDWLASLSPGVGDLVFKRLGVSRILYTWDGMIIIHIHYDR